MNKGAVRVETADLKVATAWKAGEFFFRKTPFEEMISQVARWYDIEVVYRGRVPVETFSGDMKRTVSLLTVLDLLKMSEIPFRLEGKKLIIEEK